MSQFAVEARRNVPGLAVYNVYFCIGCLLFRSPVGPVGRATVLRGGSNLEFLFFAFKQSQLLHPYISTHPPMALHPYILLDFFLILVIALNEIEHPQEKRTHPILFRQKLIASTRNISSKVHGDGEILALYYPLGETIDPR